jgi:septum formation protein
MSKRRVKLILASGSPQRRQLLAEAGYDFEVVVPSDHAECGVCSRETPGELVMRLARQKAADVAARLGGESGNSHKPNHSRPDVEYIIGCDTVAECQGQVLGKPADARHAAQMLGLLSGREHRVYSGLCVWPRASGNPQVRLARTRLKMDPLDAAQIDEYLASGAWQGKAGAFGYQDRVGWLKLIEGSESNVIGLPLELLDQMLSEATGREE